MVLILAFFPLPEIRALIISSWYGNPTKFSGHSWVTTRSCSCTAFSPRFFQPATLLVIGVHLPFSHEVTPLCLEKESRLTQPCGGRGAWTSGCKPSLRCHEILLYLYFLRLLVFSYESNGIQTLKPLPVGPPPPSQTPWHACLYVHHVLCVVCLPEYWWLWWCFVVPPLIMRSTVIFCWRPLQYREAFIVSVLFRKSERQTLPVRYARPECLAIANIAQALSVD